MHWLLVGSAENFEISRLRQFDVAGMKARWRKAAGEVTAGDSVYFYLLGHKAIGGEVRVTGPAFFDESEIWDCSKPDEHYPWRFPTKAVRIRPAGGYLPVAEFLDRYEYAKKWSPNRWTLAFQGNVHRLNDHDYSLIHELL